MYIFLSVWKILKFPNLIKIKLHIKKHQKPQYDKLVEFFLDNKC